ncbi:hypothetical protein AB1Y20_021923 [Prymnesium parvum]|uniref:Uncharacterized protein n=1 Tax=Prymnesium parvum TaxID=97485 RepID=A0AB34JHB4_PRYPA
MLAPLLAVVAMPWPAALTLLTEHGNVTLYGQPASGTPPLPETGSAAPLGVRLGGDGCARLSLQPEEAPFALLVERGSCSFDEKMRTAVHSRASLLMVADSLGGEYHFTDETHQSAATMALMDPCAVDCALGSGEVDDAGMEPSTVLQGLKGACGSRCDACAFSGRRSHGRREVCCFMDVYLDMALPGAIANHTALPAIFLSLSQASKLHSALASDPSARAIVEAYPRVSSGVDISALLILLVGTLTAALTSFVAGKTQHEQESELSLPSSGHSDEHESVSLTIQFALGFLAIATCSLVILYLLLQAGFDIVIFLLVLVFVLASANSLAHALFTPLALRMTPPTVHRLAVPLGPLANVIGTLTIPTAVGYGFSFAVAFFWFFNRRASWAWALQDALSASVCLLFLKTMRLPSLRVAAFLLFLMFFYDIFMVFLSPLVFHSSVMLEVATAGQPSASIDPSGVCQRTQGERMPMLMIIPRFAPSIGGMHAGTASDYAMLGLGDIVLPGLLLTLARRLDLCVARRGAARAAGGGGGGGGYWLAGSLAYCVGLAVTLAANMYGWTFNDAQGQPALLYLVPCTVGAVLTVALARNEAAQVWHGSLLDLPAHEAVAGRTTDTDAQPFTCCCNEYYEYDTHTVEPEHKQL